MQTFFRQHVLLAHTIRAIAALAKRGHTVAATPPLAQHVTRASGVHPGLIRVYNAHQGLIVTKLGPVPVKGVLQVHGVQMLVLRIQVHVLHVQLGDGAIRKAHLQTRFVSLALLVGLAISKGPHR